MHLTLCNLTVVKDRKPCFTVTRESELCVTARVEKEGDSTPKPKRKLWVSWQPSSREDGSEPESESEEEWKIGNETVLEISLEEWKQSNGEKDYPSQPAFTKPSAGATWESSKSIEDSGGGKNAIQENNWKVEEIMGIEEVGKEVDGNYIRVMIGGEPYLALLDLGAPISLVGPRILNKNRGRL